MLFRFLFFIIFLEGYKELEKDKDYKDYPWWLGMNEEGSWDIACYGKEGPAETKN